MARNYTLETKNYQGTPAQRTRNASRKEARRIAEKAGIVKPGDGYDVGHKDGNPLNNKPSNLKKQTVHSNRSYPRTATARKKNPKD